MSAFETVFFLIFENECFNFILDNFFKGKPGIQLTVAYIIESREITAFEWWLSK